jgi:hypothetical protein
MEKKVKENAAETETLKLTGVTWSVQTLISRHYSIIICFEKDFWFWMIFFFVEKI